jgi:nucleotide-binding universal stress UspA family protein
MYQRLLIPTDGSEGTTQAVGGALDIADVFELRTHTLYVVDTRAYSGPGRL